MDRAPLDRTPSSSLPTGEDLAQLAAQLDAVEAELAGLDGRARPAGNQPTPQAPAARPTI